jgi:hypothetical protein
MKNIDRYQSKEYDGYKHGNPQAAALELSKTLEDLERAVRRASEKAGEFLAPGLINQFKKDVLHIFETTR